MDFLALVLRSAMLFQPLRVFRAAIDLCRFTGTAESRLRHPFDLSPDSPSGLVDFLRAGPVDISHSPAARRPPTAADRDGCGRSDQADCAPFHTACPVSGNHGNGTPRPGIGGAAMISWEQPDLLRLFLFAGLLFHKLVWEVLKRRYEAKKHVKRASGSLIKRIVKSGKLFFLLFLMAQALFLNVLPISSDSAICPGCRNRPLLAGARDVGDGQNAAWPELERPRGCPGPGTA